MIPNVVIWAWMRTVLNLSGNELFVFSYIFSQCFDNQHKCYAKLSELSSIFGITRQTISRNIELLEDKNLVKKTTTTDIINPIIKHNCYQVNIDYITKLCEESDYDSYQNFLDSYSSILKQKFPDDDKQIDEYLSSLASWHKEKDTELKIKLKDLVSVIQNSTDTFTNIQQAISAFNNTVPKVYREQDYIPVNTEKQDNTKQKKLIQTPKRKSKQALKNEWDVEKRTMSNSFVVMNAGGNEELLSLINSFLTTDNGRNYTPDQWQQQLDNMYKYGRTVERMIEGVRLSYMNNYRSLYIVDRSEVDIEEKLNVINDYIVTECNNNEELKDLLCSYVLETPKGKSCTHKQFKLLLKQLSSICKTTEDKINSVRTSYTNSYAALAYTSMYNNQTASSEQDIDKKKDKIKQFISDGYYHLVPNLENMLMSYITETDVGKSMSYTNFSIILDNLRLLCFDDDDKVMRIRLAIQNNATKFAAEDFEETRKLKAKSETRETMAASLDRSRKLRVQQYKIQHPNDERVKNVESLTIGKNFL